MHEPWGVLHEPWGALHVYLCESLCAADLLPAGDEVQQVWLGMSNLITQTLGGGEAS